MDDAVPHAVRPCGECPWRVDQPAGRFPASRYEALRVTAGEPGREAPVDAPIFACHKSIDGRDIACAGWLAVVGREHLGIRLAVITGRLPAEVLDVRDGWPELYGSYADMAAVNGA